MTTKKSKPSKKGDAKDAPDEVHLTRGSKFRVVSAKGRDEVMETSGKFRGITSLGSIDAMAMELEGKDKGLVRVIPTHMVVSLDILEAAERDDHSADVDSVYYG